eukprot:COSAG01_NODE_86_length_27623_cov_39.847224_11_plen_389_part_00
MASGAHTALPSLPSLPSLPLLLAAVLPLLVHAKPLGPNVTLVGGVVMPSIGSGSMGGCGPDSFGTKDGSPCAQYNNSLLYLSLGGRALHDALSYGNQFGTGAAVRDAPAKLGIAREEIFVMSMVPREMMGYNLTMQAVEASLAQLQVDYIDLVMFHHRAADISAEPLKMKPMKAFPDHPDGVWGPPPCSVEDPTWQSCQDEGWRALVEMKARKKVRAIGVSNWMLSNLRRMKALGQELPAVNQVEAHIGWHEDDLNDWCQANGVVLQAATPMARGLDALVKPGSNQLVSSIATKYQKSPAQVALRYLLDKGIAAIPSAHSADYMKENLVRDVGSTSRAAVASQPAACTWHPRRVTVSAGPSRSLLMMSAGCVPIMHRTCTPHWASRGG